MWASFSCPRIWIRLWWIWGCFPTLAPCSTRRTASWMSLTGTWSDAPGRSKATELRRPLAGAGARRARMATALGPPGPRCATPSWLLLRNIVSSKWYPPRRSRGQRGSRDPLPPGRPAERQRARQGNSLNT